MYKSTVYFIYYDAWSTLMILLNVSKAVIDLVCYFGNFGNGNVIVKLEAHSFVQLALGSSFLCGSYFLIKNGATLV